MFAIDAFIAACIAAVTFAVDCSRAVPAVLVILEYIANITAAATMMPPASNIYSMAPWASSSFRNFLNVFKTPFVLYPFHFLLIYMFKQNINQMFTLL